jgi:hypothetical protein
LIRVIVRELSDELLQEHRAKHHLRVRLWVLNLVQLLDHDGAGAVVTVERESTQRHIDVQRCGVGKFEAKSVVPEGRVVVAGFYEFTKVLTARHFGVVRRRDLVEKRQDLIIHVGWQAQTLVVVGEDHTLVVTSVSELRHVSQFTGRVIEPEGRRLERVGHIGVTLLIELVVFEDFYGLTPVCVQGVVLTVSHIQLRVVTWFHGTRGKARLVNDRSEFQAPLERLVGQSSVLDHEVIAVGETHGSMLSLVAINPRICVDGIDDPKLVIVRYFGAVG